jgi:hypothetical protein
VPVFIAKNVGLPAELIRTPEEEMQYSMQQQQAAQLAAAQGQGEQQ